MNITFIILVIIVVLVSVVMYHNDPQGDEKIPEGETPEKYRALSNKIKKKIDQLKIMSATNPVYSEMIIEYEHRYNDFKEKERFLIENQEKL